MCGAFERHGASGPSLETTWETEQPDWSFKRRSPSTQEFYIISVCDIAEGYADEPLPRALLGTDVNAGGRRHAPASTSSGGACAGWSGGGVVGRPRWRRIAATMAGSSMRAITRARPLQRGHSSTSRPHTLRINAAHRRWRRVGGRLERFNPRAVATLAGARGFEPNRMFR